MKGKLHLCLVDVLQYADLKSHKPAPSILDKLFINSGSSRPEMSINLIAITENVLKLREDDYRDGS